MVKIRPIRAFRPKDVEDFAIKPYDVIEKEEELELKKNPKSAVHVILPDGEGNEVYSEFLYFAYMQSIQVRYSYELP